MTLLELQRRMTADVCRPLTPDFDMQKHAEDGQSMEDVASTYIAPNDRLTSFDRLEIYNRQYWLRAISAVAEDFPALDAVIGRKRFDALILAYLTTTPSMSWNLRDLSGKLPAFLAAHPKLAGRRHRLAVDVARLEWAYIEAFDGAALSPLTTEEMQAVTGDSTLRLQPYIQLLALQYPVDDLVLAIHKQQPETELVSSAAMNRSTAKKQALPPVKKQPTYLAVHRFDDSVYYRSLEREWFVLLEALRAGATLQQALEQALKGSRATPEEQADIVQQCFAIAAELGWFASAQ